MTIVLLINGLVFFALLFSGNLSDKKGSKGEKTAYIGFGIFLVIAIISSILFYRSNFETLKIITWVATIIMSVSILVKLFYLSKKR